MRRTRPETTTIFPSDQVRGVKPVTLHDGRVTDNYSEEWLLECLARVIMSLPTLQQRREALEKVDRKQGLEYGAKLRGIIRALWNA